MRKTILLAGASLMLVSNAYANDLSFTEGKKLFKENCLSCHDAQLDPPLAPPMLGVQMKYKMVSSDKDAFVEKVTSFATHPTSDKAILRGPVKMLGLMPDLGFEEKDVRTIAAYIHDETFAAPCGHWKSAMVRFKESGDNMQYRKHKDKYDTMCLQDVKPAEEGSLKAIMRQLGRDYALVDQAILLEDFDGAADAAHRIAFHDKPAMSQKMKLMASLRTEMPDFKVADGKVHGLAIEIEKAAKAKDMTLLIKKQSQMLSACMSCHSSFRSRVVKILSD